MSTVKGRLGFFPCDYDTYRKLKRLNFFMLESRRRDAAWERWNAKDPHNRLLYKRTLVTGLLHTGGEGQFKIKEVIGPAPEPVLAPVVSITDGIDFIKAAPKRDTIRQIAANYEYARYPKQTESEVQELTLTSEVIDAALKSLEEWYATKIPVCV